MSESIETSEGIIRGIEEPKVARASKEKPKKARVTGDTFASLRKNRSLGKLPERIKRYNEEYAKLVELAKSVNEGRKEAETKADGEEQNLAYTEVSKKIEAYNAQAAKLANLGVQVLAFDKGIQRIEKEENKNARAIKVPNFVLKALDTLNIAAANKIREGMAKREKAQTTLVQDVQNAILAAAEEAIDQDAKGTLSQEGLASLKLNGENSLADTVYNSLVDENGPDVESVTADVEENAVGSKKSDGSDVIQPPKSDISEPAENVASTTTPTPPAVDPVAVAREAGASAAKKGTGAVSKNVEGAIADMKKANESKIEERKNNELKEVCHNFLESSSVFDALRVVGENFYIVGDDEDKKLRFMSLDGEAFAVTPEQLAKAMGLSDLKSDEIKLNYTKMLSIVKANDMWQITAGNDPYNPELKEMFDAVAKSVMEGKTSEEIIEAGKPFFDDPQVAEISLSTCATDQFKVGMGAMSTFGHSVKTENEVVEEPVVGETPVSVDKVDIKVRVVDETLKKLANGLRLNKANGMGSVVLGSGDQPVVDPVQPVEPVEQPIVDPVQPAEPVEQPVVDPVQPAEPVEQQSENVRKISELENEMVALARIKNNLIENGINDPELMAKLDANIKSLTNKMSSLLDNNVVELGTPSEEREVNKENPVAVEPVVEERVPERVEWLERALSVLDDPDQKARQDLLTDVERAKFERRMAEERAERELADREFNERRDALVAANRERTATLRAKREVVEAERARMNARDILAYIGRNGERAYSDEFINEIEDPVAFLNELREVAPNEVARAEDRRFEANSIMATMEEERVLEQAPVEERQPGVTRVPVRRVVRREEPVVEERDADEIQALIDEANEVRARMDARSAAEQAPVEERQPGVTRVPVRRVRREEPVVEERDADEIQALIDEANEVRARMDAKSVTEQTPVESMIGEDITELDAFEKALEGLSVSVPTEKTLEVTDTSSISAPKENIDLVMELIVKEENMDHRYDSDTTSHAFFDENPRIRQEYESQYVQAAGPNFWELVANGYTPMSSTNSAVESVRLDRRAKAARDFLGFAYSLDDEMLDTMERNGESPLHVLNSLPKEDVEKNLELYGRYLESKRDRVEAERDGSMSVSR